jgi:choline kinase
VKAIIIGAGRGKRLERLTDELPKTLVTIVGRPILESILEALRAGGFGAEKTIFIRGYRGELVEAAHPELAYVENAEWESNNILLSLLCARGHMGQGFVSSYADIVYEPRAVSELVASPHDITLVCDTAWRRRYEKRSRHPETDAEKMTVKGDRVVALSRHVPSAEAAGEFIGVMRMTPAGAARFLAAFDALAARIGLDTPFHEGRTLRKAYLIDLLEHMNRQGEPLHASFLDGGYMEIDTTEDAAHAEQWWRDRPEA